MRNRKALLSLSLCLGALNGQPTVARAEATMSTPKPAFMATLRGDVLIPERGPATPEGVVHLIRPAVSGDGFDGSVRYFLQAEVAGRPRLLDAEITWSVDEALRVRMGQMRPPFGRAFITPIFALQMPGRSIISDTFRADRDVGLSLQGLLWDGALEYAMGAYNGAGAGERGNDNPRLMYLGRVVVSPLGPVPYDETCARAPGPTRLSLGVGGYTNRSTRSHQAIDPGTGQLVTVRDAEVQRQTLGVDFALRTGSLFFTGEGFTDWQRPLGQAVTQRVGAYVQGGVMVSPRDEIVARAALLVPDWDERALDGLRRYAVGFNHYFQGNALKAQLYYGYTEVGSPATGLPVSVNAHDVIAQLQLFL